MSKKLWNKVEITPEEEALRADYWRLRSKENPKLYNTLDRMFDKLVRFTGVSKGGFDGLSPVPGNISPDALAEIIVESGLLTRHEAEKNLQLAPSISAHATANHNIIDNYGFQKTEVARKADNGATVNDEMRGGVQPFVVDDYGTAVPVGEATTGEYYPYAIDIRTMPPELAAKIVNERAPQFEKWLLEHSHSKRGAGYEQNSGEPTTYEAPVNLIGMLHHAMNVEIAEGLQLGISSLPKTARLLKATDAGGKPTQTLAFASERVNVEEHMRFLKSALAKFFAEGTAPTFAQSASGKTGEVMITLDVTNLNPGNMNMAALAEAADKTIQAVTYRHLDSSHQAHLASVGNHHASPDMHSLVEAMGAPEPPTPNENTTFVRNGRHTNAARTAPAASPAGVTQVEPAVEGPQLSR